MSNLNDKTEGFDPIDKSGRFMIHYLRCSRGPASFLKLDAGDPNSSEKFEDGAYEAG